MYVRLAFAVAAHLEPEILIVDEVLAVGDTEFQKKCLGKMKHVAGEGRTVLFVSHHLATLRALCTRGLLLADGRILSDGSIDGVIRRYANAGSSAYSVSFAAKEARPSISAIAVDQMALVNRDLIVDISFVSPRPLHTAVGGIVLMTDTGEPVWGTNSRLHPSAVSIKAIAHGVLRCEARGLPVRPGQYHLSAWLADWHEDLDARDNALTIHIGENDGDRPGLPVSNLGHIDWPAAWSSIRGEDASAA
jgi:homopolymeric O-antigen transport system ATP-binding protein